MDRRLDKVALVGEESGGSQFFTCFGGSIFKRTFQEQHFAFVVDSQTKEGSRGVDDV